jgi:hypothetical protein
MKLTEEPGEQILRIKVRHGMVLPELLGGPRFWVLAYGAAGRSPEQALLAL